MTFIFSVVAVLAVSAGYIYLTTHLGSYLENNISDNVRRELLLGKDLIESSISDQAGSVDFQALAARMGRDLALRVTIIGLNGKVLGDSDLSREQARSVENHANRPEIKDAIATGYGVSKRFSYTVNKQMMYAALVFGHPGPQGILRFAVPLHDVELLQGKMQESVVLGLACVLALMLVLSFLVSSLISSPLSEMASVARSMAGGDFLKKIPIHSKDEIGELADALNSMSDQMREKIAKISSESAKLDLVLSSMFEGVIVTDEKERIILMNPSLRKLFFVDRDPNGKRPLEVIRNTSVQDMVDRILKGRQGLATEEIVIAMPEEKILKVNGVPILHNDLLEGAILVFHDITELRRLEKIRQDFVANVSHELRTPISSIKGYSETLLEGAIEDKDNAREFINIIHQESNRLAALITDLLDLSKIESGKMKMSFEPLDPAVIIRRSIAIIENQAKAKSIPIDFQASADLPLIKADETRFSQVMLNLLDNAIKYTPQGGAITIRAERSETNLQIEVQDTGMGISETDIPRIFERFYRVDKARSRELGGTGLGLSIVKHIVQAHSGQVWLKSELGKGSTFSFTIPLA